MIRPLIASLIGLGLLSLSATADSPKEGMKPIFNGKDFEGWKTILENKADPAKTWTIKDGVIECTGRPNGYFYTDKSYKNYVLVYDWKYVRPSDLKDDANFGGNSGALVHIQGEHKVWPKCVEVQGMNKEHGKIFAIMGAKGTYSFDDKTLLKVRKPVGEWNTTEITSKGGKLTSKVNGTVIGDGEGELKEGPIGFQSEGAPIHFRNIKIKVLE